MEFLNQYSFEVIFFAAYQHYFTIILGLMLVYKLKITGSLLLVHGISVAIYMINYSYERDHVSELIKTVYGAFYEENLFYVMLYGTLSIPIIIVIGLILDLRIFKKIKS